MTAPATPTAADRLVRQAFAIANAAVVADIQSNAVRVTLQGMTFWDVRAMTDPHEHDGQVIDMAQQAIDYALAAGVAMQHPTQKHLVRFTPG